MQTLDNFDEFPDRVRRVVAGIPDSLRDELTFEMEMFVSRLELLESRGWSADFRATIEYDRIRSDLYDFLREDLVDFLQKVLVGRELPAGFPDLRPIHREVLRILREMGIYAFYPQGKDFSQTTIVERWYGWLFEENQTAPEHAAHYFTIYRNRLYGLSSSSPYGFGDLSRLVRRFIAQKEVAFSLSLEQVYRSELKLREEILFALLRRFSPRSRLDYLVAKEMIVDRSEHFISVLHREVESYFKRLLRVQGRQHRRTVEQKTSMEREVANAARLHRKQLQTDLPDGDARVQFAIAYQPFMTLSGDFYRISRISDDEYALLLCDIAGHGLGAAMYLNTVKHSFDRFVRYHHRPDRLMERMNEDLYGKLDDNFVTAISVYVHLGKRRIEYCNAGHPKGFLVYLHDQRQKIRFLRQNGRVLGVFREGGFRTDRLDLHERNRLIIYTDGLTETMNESDEMLGERGLLDLFDGTTTRPIQETIDTVQSGLRTFQGREPVADDRTLILCDLDLRVDAVLDEHHAKTSGKEPEAQKA